MKYTKFTESFRSNSDKTIQSQLALARALYLDYNNLSNENRSIEKINSIGSFIFQQIT